MDGFEVIIDFEAFIKWQFGLSIHQIQIDNQQGFISGNTERETPFEMWSREEEIILEPTPVYTKKPNETAEWYGQIIQSKAQTMRIAANLPEELWTEYWTAAGYLHNQIPSYRNDWKSPIEVLNAYMKAHNIPFNGNPNDLRPDWSRIFAYGAKAYPLMTKYKKGGMKIHFKSNVRTHIGYLVGYWATNIFWVWIPKLWEVITTRNVTFEKDEFFNSDKKEEPQHQTSESEKAEEGTSANN